MMATKLHEESGLSWFKYNFFVFMRVFIYYLVFAALCLFVILFCDASSGIARVTDLSPEPAFTKTTLVRAAFVMIGTGLYFIVIQLKSFVFNVYHVVATWVRWEAENPENDK